LARVRRHSEIIPGGTDYWTGLFAQEKRATIAVTTRNRSKTPRPNEELSATPYAAVKETSAKTSNASVMQTDKSKGPKPCDCCLQTQREALITMAKRTRTSAMLKAIPMEDRILRPAAEGRQAAYSILESESDIVKRSVPAIFCPLVTRGGRLTCSKEVRSSSGAGGTMRIQGLLAIDYFDLKCRL